MFNVDMTWETNILELGRFDELKETKSFVCLRCGSVHLVCFLIISRNISMKKECVSGNIVKKDEGEEMAERHSQGILVRLKRVKYKP